MNMNTILTGSDRMNSVQWRSDVGAVHYTPYGTADKDTPGNIGFNGERQDPVSGHIHLGNGYRSYSPALMRFTCPDSMSPFGAGGINPYAYCGGDPVNRADPSGHMSTGQGVGLGLGLLAGILLSIFTGGASLAVALALDVAGGAVIGAGSELVAEGIDHQKINWGAVGISAGMGAAMSLVGFGLGKVGAKAYNRVGKVTQSIISSAHQRENVVLGGTMKNLDSLGQDFYLFDDTYKEAKRLNLVAHGALENDGTARVARTSEINMNADEIFSIISKRKNLQEYSNIRTIMCHSGNGEKNSFGQRLATLTGIPVKSYRGTVTGNFELESLNKLLLETATKYGDDGLEHMQAEFAMRHIFKIYKENPYKFFSFEYFGWNFKPLKFTP